MLSTVVLLVLAFTLLGLLLGFAESFDAPRAESPARDPEAQSKLFEDCIKDAESDGELTGDEYYRCAYGIYG